LEPNTFKLITKHLGAPAAFGVIRPLRQYDSITQPNVFAGKVLARLYFVRRLTTLPVRIASAQIVLVRARSVTASGEPTDIAFLSSAGLRFIGLELQRTI
jgi:hypothetical protein